MTPFARAALLPVAGMVLAGCGLIGAISQAPPPKGVGAWSLTPLSPDPALAASAVGPGGPCRMDDNPADDVEPPAPQILIQDRRTKDTAAFLVLSPQHFGQCLLTRGAGSGGGFGPLLDPMTGLITIDSIGTGTVGNDSTKVVGGRFSVPASSIVVVLKDEVNVVASFGNGYWLAWWPWTGGVNADQVIAFDANGKVLASVDVVNE